MFRFTSPLLSDEGRSLRECPVGAVLREAPHVYDVLAVYANSKNSGLEITGWPLWVRRALSVVEHEANRLRDMADKERQAHRDAQYGHRLVRGR